MANSPQSRKRARQNIVSRVRNHSQASAMRTYIKKFLKAVNANDTDNAKQAYQVATSHIDKFSRKSGLHKNRAARLKSRLNNRLRAISG